LSAAPCPAAEAAALHQLGWLMHRRAMESMVDGAGIAASLFGVGLVRQALRRDPGGSIGLFRAALPLAEEHTDRPAEDWLSRAATATA
jgi:hypothetical protein